jgi:hypothetical protein
MTRAQFMSGLARIGASLDTDCEDFDLNVDAPKGRVFAYNGCHCICVPYNNSGGQSWKPTAYANALAQASMGLMNCQAEDCDVCSPAPKITRK